MKCDYNILSQSKPHSNTFPALSIVTEGKRCCARFYCSIYPTIAVYSLHANTLTMLRVRKEVVPRFRAYRSDIEVVPTALLPAINCRPRTTTCFSTRWLILIPVRSYGITRAIMRLYLRLLRSPQYAGNIVFNPLATRDSTNGYRKVMWVGPTLPRCTPPVLVPHTDVPATDGRS